MKREETIGILQTVGAVLTIFGTFYLFVIFAAAL
jgi:hypothetical protein